MFKCLFKGSNLDKYKKLQRRIELQNSIALEKILRPSDMPEDEDNQGENASKVFKRKIQRTLLDAYGNMTTDEMGSS